VASRTLFLIAKGVNNPGSGHGNTAGRQALQAASVALASVGDEISRWPLPGGNSDLGLRGGRVRFSGGSGMGACTCVPFDGEAGTGAPSGAGPSPRLP
jgi:hypothetical protein